MLPTLTSRKLPLAAVLLFAAATSYAQAPAAEKPMSGAEIKAASGDEAATPAAIANDLSPKIESKAIRAAMVKVADWQLSYAEPKFNQDWTYAPLYLGLLQASTTTGNPRYADAVLKASERFQWKLWATRQFHADDEAIGQAYEALYTAKKDNTRIADTRATFDRLVARPDDPQKDLWWWCDALFMAPAGMARMSAITGDHKYIDKMNAEWQLTTDHLFVPDEHLFLRDNSYVGKTEANGQKIFWGRGNGWVIAGTVNVLRALPNGDPSRAKYVALLKEMSDRLAGLQQPDGLWHTGLLNQAAYPLPEISGSAFFTYAMAWGVNEGLLDRAKYGPVIEKAWRGMLQHVYTDGRLGCIQPIGAAPGAFGPTSSYVYGVGGFLMAGAEMDRYAKAKR